MAMSTRKRLWGAHVARRSPEAQLTDQFGRLSNPHARQMDQNSRRSCGFGDVFRRPGGVIKAGRLAKGLGRFGAVSLSAGEHSG